MKGFCGKSEYSKNDMIHKIQIRKSKNRNPDMINSIKKKLIAAENGHLLDKHLIFWFGISKPIYILYTTFIFTYK